MNIEDVQHEKPVHAEMNREDMDVSSSDSDSDSLPGEDLNHLVHSIFEPLPSNGNKEVIGGKGIIKRVEFVRVIVDALYSLGFGRSAALLEEESGIQLYSSTVSEFRLLLLGGHWDESLIRLHGIGVTDDRILEFASFIILEHKFLELLLEGRDMDALRTLRTELSPLGIYTKRVHELSTLILSPSMLALRLFGARDVGSVRSKLLEKLQAVFPPTILIPHRRLERLVEQALDSQTPPSTCLNSFDDSISLYSDHQRSYGQIPSHCLQVLDAHNGVVLCVQFSNNGKYLASSSKSAIIWEVYPDKKATLKHTLIGHEKLVAMLAWSPDDGMLLTCGQERFVRCWDVSSGDCLHVYENKFEFTSCAWLPDGKRFVTGLSTGSIAMWDVEGTLLECWEGERTDGTYFLAVTSNGKWIISICDDNTILLFNEENKVEERIMEYSPIGSFSVSGNGRYLLVSLMNHRMHVWDITGKPKFDADFVVARVRFALRSCFGGENEAFIACGLSDLKIDIWHRSKAEPMSTLHGHCGSVNCVSWNPTNPHMLASGSGDSTVRIWGVQSISTMGNYHENNRVAHLNRYAGD